MVVIEEKTRNVTLVNSFKRIKADTFPSPPVPMDVYTVLSDGLGDIPLDLSVVRCDTLEEIYLRSSRVNFKNPLQQIRLYWHVQSCSFPVPGRYEFGLHADRELLTQAVLTVFD
jgi:hypothetical protein